MWIQKRLALLASLFCICAGSRGSLELFELLAENAELVTKWNIKVRELLEKDVSDTRLTFTL